MGLSKDLILETRAAPPQSPKMTRERLRHDRSRTEQFQALTRPSWLARHGVRLTHPSANRDRGFRKPWKRLHHPCSPLTRMRVDAGQGLDRPARLCVWPQGPSGGKRSRTTGPSPDRSAILAGWNAIIASIGRRPKEEIRRSRPHPSEPTSLPLEPLLAWAF